MLFTGETRRTRSILLDLIAKLRQLESMFVSLQKFSIFATRLWFEAIKRPRSLNDFIQDIPLEKCLKFGWICFFIGGFVSAGFQYVFVSELLYQVTADSNLSLEIEKTLSLFDMPTMDGLQERLDFIRLSSYAAVFLSPLSAFVFLHLISGALYVILRAISLLKAKDPAYEKVMKIVAVGQAPMVFCALPLIGPILGTLWTIWLIARLLGSVVDMSLFGRVGVVSFSFVFLFSFWNSTVSQLVGAYHRSEKVTSSSSANLEDRESNPNAKDLI